MSEPARAKRILYVITKATWGGAQRYVYELATAAHAHHYDVAVAYGTPGLLLEKLGAFGIRAIELPHLSRDLNLRSEWKAFLDLVKLIKSERPDIIHINSSKGGLAALAARIAGVPRIIFTAHGWAFNEERVWWQKVIIRLAYIATLWLSHRTICVSDSMRHQMSWVPFAHLTTVRNAVEAPEFLPRDAARSELVLGMKDAVWVGMIAELHPSKRVEDAIDAIAELTPSHPELMLVVIGDGELRQKLEERIKHYNLHERVRLAGFKDDAARYLAAFDYFLMPSRTEALGIALLEAGHAGLPVVAARVGGIPEIIQHKRTGLLVPKENPHALARALRTLIEHPVEAKEYAAALHRRITERFSKEEMLADTFELYSYAPTYSCPTAERGALLAWRDKDTTIPSAANSTKICEPP